MKYKDMEINIKRNKITVPYGKTEYLAKEFDVSIVSIQNALKDITKSKLAKRIRTRAKEILEKEVKSIEI